MPIAAAALAKKMFHLQAKQMQCRSSGRSRGQCSVCCRRMSSGAGPSARWVGEAQRREFSFAIFDSNSSHRTFTFRLAIILTHLSPQGSQFSKHSSISDSSQLTFLGCPSSSSYDVYVEEACEVVLAASGQEVVSDSYYVDTETAALQNEDLRLLLELSSSQYGKYKNNHDLRLFPLILYLPAVYSCRFMPGCFYAVWTRWVPDVGGGAVCFWVCRGHSSALEGERSAKLSELWASYYCMVVMRFCSSIYWKYFMITAFVSNARWGSGQDQAT